jgi:Uma2 family endonuclease
MLATVTERPSPPVIQFPPRKRWTRAECDRLEALGMFEQQRLELIEGELIVKMPKTRPHAGTATLLMAWLIKAFGGRRVGVEAPIDVAPEDNPTNQPIPDIFVAKYEYAASTHFWSSTPQPGDLDLVVEIADTSLPFDLTIQAALYARAGIVEYWILDVTSRRLLVHRSPQVGQYGSVTSYSEDESVAPLSAPNSSFAVRQVFPE